MKIFSPQFKFWFITLDDGIKISASAKTFGSTPEARKNVEKKTADLVAFNVKRKQARIAALTPNGANSDDQTKELKAKAQFEINGFKQRAIDAFRDLVDPEYLLNMEVRNQHYFTSCKPSDCEQYAGA